MAGTLTPDEVRLVAPVYASAAILAQYPGPRTSRRYAYVVGLGLFGWFLDDGTATDDTTVIGSTGGAAGRWKIVDSHEAALTVAEDGAIDFAWTVDDGEALIRTLRFRTTTTDETETPVTLLTAQVSKTVLADVTAIARGASGSVTSRVLADVHWTSGGVGTISDNSLIHPAPAGAWTLELAMNGNALVANVTGTAATDLVWTIYATLSFGGL